MVSLSFAVLSVLAGVVVVPPGKGVEVGPIVEVGAPKSLGRSPSVVTDKTGITVVWSESRTNTTRCIEARRLARDGTPTGAVTEIACGNILTTPRVALGGPTPIVMWGGEKGVVGVTFNGKATKPAFKIDKPDYTSMADIAWDGARYWIVWSNYSDIWVQTASASGALTGKPEQLAKKWGGQVLQLGHLGVTCAKAKCTIAFSSFLGNSASDYYTVAIDKGKVGALAKLDENAWQDQRGEDGDAEATTAEGTFMAMHDDQKSVLSIMFTPADPKHAHHTPIQIPSELDPAVVAVDAKTFLLFTSASQISVRKIKIDPAYFANVPAPRPALVSGTVLTSDGKPAGGAHVAYTLTFTSGDTMSSSGVLAQRDGSFTILHPSPNDHDPELDVSTLEVWASRDGEQSKPQSTAAGSQVTVRMGPPGHVSGTIEAAKGIDVTIDASLMTADSTLRSQSGIWGKKITAREKFDLGDVPSGILWIMASAKDGRMAFYSTKLEAGQQLHPKLTLERPGSVVIRMQGGEDENQLDAMPIVEGVDINTNDVNPGDDGAYEFKDLAPGRRQLVIVSGNWEMTRMITIKPRGHTQLRVRFEADVRPGMIGVALEQTQYGIQADVAPGSPASRGGMSNGDQILEIDGTKPATANDAVKLLRGTPGSTLKLLVSNGAGTHPVTVTRSTGTGAFAPKGIPAL